MTEARRITQLKPRFFDAGGNAKFCCNKQRCALEVKIQLKEDR